MIELHGKVKVQIRFSQKYEKLHDQTNKTKINLRQKNGKKVNERKRKAG